MPILYINIPVCKYMLLGQTCRHYDQPFDWSQTWLQLTTNVNMPYSFDYRGLCDHGLKLLNYNWQIYKPVYQLALLLFTLNSIYKKPWQWHDYILEKLWARGLCLDIVKSGIWHNTRRLNSLLLWCKKLKPAILHPQVCLGYIINSSR